MMALNSPDLQICCIQPIKLVTFEPGHVIRLRHVSFIAIALSRSL